MTHYRHVGTCRSCGAGSLTPVLDLGVQTIANKFHKSPDDMLPSAPLVLSRCEHCGLAQLADAVAPSVMYNDYWYTSSINATMRAHLQADAELAMRHGHVSTGSVILDIGCNDGTFLSHFPHCRRIGVDPSNIPSTGCVRIQDYFSYDAVRDALKGERADIVSSIAMFYGLNTPRHFVADVRRVLKDDGLWLLELCYLPAMIANTAYDSICHEHAAYYTLRTFMDVLSDTDLVVCDVDFNSVNGGSFCMIVRPRGVAGDSVRRALTREDELGYDGTAPFTQFVQRVAASRRDLTEFLTTAHNVYGYGASTKGQVIMQYCGITSLVAIAERNPRKYGLLTPGTNVPICSEDEMRRARPHWLLAFPWYFLPEFREREQSLRDSGTRIVVPLPEFAIC